MESKISNVTTVSFARIAFEGIKNKSSSDDAALVKLAETRAEKKEAEANGMGLNKAKELAEEVKEIPENTQRNLLFKVDNETQQVVMSLIDKVSGKVIRQLPSEEALALAKRLQKTEGDPGGIIEDSV